MLDLKELRLLVERYLKFKMVRITVLSLAGFFLVALSLECWFNLWLRSSLRDSLGWGNDPQVKIKASLNWLSLYDLFQGKVQWVRVKAENCLFSNLRFSRLNLINEGFTFNLPVLLGERRLELRSINITNIEAIVTAAAFSNYLQLLYPQFKPTVKIVPGELLLTGQAQIFGNNVPVELVGKLKISAPKNLRFFPTRLLIAGRTVPQSFLDFAGNQVPLEFSLLKEWPLEIKEVSLKNGFVFFSFQESGAGKR